LTEPRQRRRTAFFVVLLASLLTAALVPLPTAARDPAGIDTFLRALGQIESGGRYKARNASSGAYGKYQIMPANWPTWARKYLGDADASWSPRNQERVARGKVKDLYRWLGTWPNVAHWWLTGNGETRRSRWSSSSRRYVDKIMRLYKEYGGAGSSKPKAAQQVRVQETSGLIRYEGSWKRARHSGYSNGAVRYATAAGATASFTFTGRSVTWIGPEGRTRGKANIYIDGVYVRTVDLYASSFRTKQQVFRMTWKTSRERTIVIKVLGTRGHPMVAIDAFVVGN
jgi:hypothetical protein